MNKNYGNWIGLCAVHFSLLLSGCNSTPSQGESMPSAYQEQVKDINSAKLVLEGYLTSDSRLLSDYVDFPFMSGNGVVIRDEEKDFYADSALFMTKYDVNMVAVNYMAVYHNGDLRLLPGNARFPSLLVSLEQKLHRMTHLKGYSNPLYVIELFSSVGDIRSRILIQDVVTKKVVADF